jgi:phage-related protein
MNYFVINDNINSRTDLGLRITERPSLPVSERIVQKIDVDGREGTLNILKGWKDADISFKAALLGADIRNRHRAVTAQIRAAQTVWFSGDPMVFYKVKAATTGALDMRLSQLGEFAITFGCAPFGYLRNAATINRTTSGTVNNPGTVYSLPKIRVYGAGTRSLTINGKPVTLNLLSSPLAIDSELKECYFGDTAQNHLMTGDFPRLEVGSNTVTLGTGITKVEIEPRWRFL